MTCPSRIRLTERWCDHMKVLLTGNLGYIGSVMGPYLQQMGYDVVGFDIGYFAESVFGEVNADIDQILGDIRDTESLDLRKFDAIVHLAGLSNDPLGAFRPGLTDEINFRATIRLAEKAKSDGVERFVYASSQSMYGIAKNDDEIEEDNSEKHPLTDYARTKWEAEVKIKELVSDEFIVTCMRPSTVFGVSPRMRCDIVFNNLVASAYTTGKVEIKSDGTPWRPVVHIKDVCSAFSSGLEAPANLVNGRSYNVGIPNGNFTVRQLAEAAQRAVPGSEIIYTGVHGNDERTYRVSFDRILNELKDFYRPSWNLDRGGAELVQFFDAVKLTEEDFKGPKTNRLLRLKEIWSDLPQ